MKNLIFLISQNIPTLTWKGNGAKVPGWGDPRVGAAEGVENWDWKGAGAAAMLEAITEDGTFPPLELKKKKKH